MNLEAYLVGIPIEIRPAPLQRAWMDATPDKFAYRCLPMNIANQHGWELLCPYDIVSRWDGGTHAGAVQVEANSTPVIAQGHFGSGILTFHTNYLFRTEQNIDLYVTGPVNEPKDGIAPLSGIVETDWNPATFTMNWKFTRPNHPVMFRKGEPFCCVFPLQRGLIEAQQPSVKHISVNPELEAQYHGWSQSRNKFLVEKDIVGSDAHKRGWEKDYMQGKETDGTIRRDHKTKLRLQSFDHSNFYGDK